MLGRFYIPHESIIKQDAALIIKYNKKLLSRKGVRKVDSAAAALLISFSLHAPRRIPEVVRTLNDLAEAGIVKISWRNIFRLLADMDFPHDMAKQLIRTLIIMLFTLEGNKGEALEHSRSCNRRASSKHRYT
jgi:hypothetical protein